MTVLCFQTGREKIYFPLRASVFSLFRLSNLVFIITAAVMILLRDQTHSHNILFYCRYTELSRNWFELSYVGYNKRIKPRSNIEEEGWRKERKFFSVLEFGAQYDVLLSAERGWFQYLL